MSTNVVVIRDNISTSSAPLVLTTKFDSDHEYTAETNQMTYADIQANVYLSCGDAAMSLDFGVFGNVADEALEQDTTKEIAAIDSLISALTQARTHIVAEFQSIKDGA